MSGKVPERSDSPKVSEKSDSAYLREIDYGDKYDATRGP